jgi:hypothetical protein
MSAHTKLVLLDRWTSYLSLGRGLKSLVHIFLLDSRVYKEKYDNHFFDEGYSSCA